jgi:hypothetical protein
VTAKPDLAPEMKWVGVIFLYVILTLVMTEPLINLSALGSACYEGDARLIVWTLAWDNHAVLNRLPLFEANSFYPAASNLAYNEHLFGLSLFTLPIYAATRNPILAYNIVWLLAFLFNGIAMHSLVRYYTRQHVAGLVGGAIYAFSFYNMHHAPGHLAYLWKWLLPLSLLLFEHWSAKPTFARAAKWGLAILLQALSGWYLAVFVLVTNAVLIVWRTAAVVRNRWIARVWHVAVVGLIGAAAIWPFAAPYRELERPSIAEVARLSADWASYGVPPENTLVGQLWLSHLGTGPRWMWGEQTLFLGWLATAFAAVGVGALVIAKRWREGGVYLLLAVVGLALSFGPSLPATRGAVSAFDLLALLPGMGGLRAPARFGVLVLLGVAMLAAFGVAELQRRFGRKVAIAVAVLVPLMLAEWFVVKFPLGQPRPVAIPAIYASEPVRTARALVSLPDYRGTAAWYLGADYLLFSTAHWRPIVNGFGRSEPPNYLHVISHMNAFPGPNNAKTMRTLGVEYVVLHASRYPDGAVEIVRGARESPEYDLVWQSGTDYLFRVRPVPKE